MKDFRLRTALIIAGLTGLTLWLASTPPPASYYNLSVVSNVTARAEYATNITARAALETPFIGLTATNGIRTEIYTAATGVVFGIRLLIPTGGPSLWQTTDVLRVWSVKSSLTDASLTIENGTSVQRLGTGE